MTSPVYCFKLGNWKKILDFLSEVYLAQVGKKYDRNVSLELILPSHRKCSSLSAAMPTEKIYCITVEERLPAGFNVCLSIPLSEPLVLSHSGHGSAGVYRCSLQSEGGLPSFFRTTVGSPDGRMYFPKYFLVGICNLTTFPSAVLFGNTRQPSAHNWIILVVFVLVKSRVITRDEVCPFSWPVVEEKMHVRRQLNQNC